MVNSGITLEENFLEVIKKEITMKLEFRAVSNDETLAKKNDTKYKTLKIEVIENTGWKTRTISVKHTFC